MCSAGLSPFCSINTSPPIAANTLKKMPACTIKFSPAFQVLIRLDLCKSSLNFNTQICRENFLEFVKKLARLIRKKKDMKHEPLIASFYSPK
jgi:hypothetical protein